MGPSESLIVYCAGIVLASLAGGAIPMAVRLTHRRLQFGLSFVSGVMLGVALFHMVPHALMARMEAGAAGAAGHGLFDPLMIALALGFVAMFFLERFAHFHQHEPPEPPCDDPAHGSPEHAHVHSAGCDHGHRPRRRAGHAEPPQVGRLTWAGAATGMGIHSLLEGVALAASIEAVRADDHGAAVAGLGTFLVILLHKPFDAMTVSTLFAAGGGGRVRMVLVNVLFALLVPVGAALFLAGVTAAGDAAVAVPYALAFSAGTFLCIAAADILPEVQFHRHDRVGLSVALVLGIAVALGIARLEAASHDHDHVHDDGAAEACDDPTHDHSSHRH
jgi:zinc and cadmium transporter